MDANEDANVEFMAVESAAALKRNAAATGSLSAKNDGCLLSGSATLILPGMYSHSNLYGCIRSLQRFCRGFRGFLFEKNTFGLCDQ